ncbi:DUF3649 domain-containing protein [Roseicella frigidaeris]|uniref:Iron transporter n=1 Tax=Roseicella frigidaeris TaxID=2230885 RepID=A0A327MBZ6_9PROT|nr:DUF3649 domain-containing protein [Roseicella frigidaeris]RAI59704.1 iron transporter [Roseicella frigidaeris]
MRSWHWPGVLSRSLAAVLGGYAVAALAATALALWLPTSRAEAVLTGTMLSFALYAGAVLWVFAAASALRAWVGLLLPAALLGALVWLGGGAG